MQNQSLKDIAYRSRRLNIRWISILPSRKIHLFLTLQKSQSSVVDSHTTEDNHQHNSIGRKASDTLDSISWDISTSFMLTLSLIEWTACKKCQNTVVPVGQVRHAQTTLMLCVSQLAQCLPGTEMHIVLNTTSHHQIRYSQSYSAQMRVCQCWRNEIPTWLD